jgi:DNA-binding MarR family transcriptional regulator
LSRVHRHAAALAGNLAALRRLGTLLDRLEQEAADALGITHSDLRCLEILLQREAVTAGELAEAIGLSPNALSAALGRLEAKAYIRRVHPEADRRQVLVSMTAAARTDVLPVFGKFVRAAARLYRRYEPGEIEQVTRFLDDLDIIFRRLAAGERR